MDKKIFGRGRAGTVPQAQVGPGRGGDRVGLDMVPRARGSSVATLPASSILEQGPRPGTSSISSLGRGTSHRVAEEPNVGGTRTKGNGNGNGNRGALRGKRVINELIITKPIECISKRGKSGKEVILQTNHFRALRKPEWSLYQYRVDFAPEQDYIKVRKGIIYSYRDRFGGNIFDGTVLFCCRKLHDEDLEIGTKNNNTGELIKVTLKFVGILKPTDYQSLQILNLILRKSMEGLKLQLVGRNLFDAVARINVSAYKLELWPGYATSFRQHERDILLCGEILHKVMRTETVYDCLKTCYKDDRDYKESFKKKVIGVIVITDYNNKTYRVDDVDYNSSPNNVFETKDGNISYIDYYAKRYNIKIRDSKQPLLISKSTDKRMRGGESEFIMLIPELCRATGLTESMKSDFKIMKALSTFTRIDPAGRIQRLKAFNDRLRNEKESVGVLNSWDLELERHLVELPGRILCAEDIYLGNNAKVKNGPDADWTRELRKRPMLINATLKRWFVVVPPRSQQDGNDFARIIIQVARGMHMEIAEPRTVVINDDRNTTYVKALEDCCRKDPQLIFMVVPNNNAERYSCIKKKLCVDRAVPSQVIVHRTIDSKKKSNSDLMSVATKVAIQLNCKLMGVPWTVHIPCRGLMTVGFDVCHSTRDRSKSYGALIATMDMKVEAKFYSTVSEHGRGNELSNEIATNMTKALRQYREIHGTLPERILFYRDGVGDGEINQVYQHEVKHLRECLDSIYRSAEIETGCPLCFIIVSKRINARLFLNSVNPPPGTVVDDVITLPERYDFFLISQSVRQGTVSPTSYNVIHDTIGLSADQIQILTYKFTHLYYNFSGTTRVPAVCQYAHKLAFLVGQCIHQTPSNLLEKQLYFL